MIDRYQSGHSSRRSSTNFRHWRWTRSARSSRSIRRIEQEVGAYVREYRDELRRQEVAYVPSPAVLRLRRLIEEKARTARRHDAWPCRALVDRTAVASHGRTRRSATRPSPATTRPSRSTPFALSDTRWYLRVLGGQEIPRPLDLGSALERQGLDRSIRRDVGARVIAWTTSQRQADTLPGDLPLSPRHELDPMIVVLAWNARRAACQRLRPKCGRSVRRAEPLPGPHGGTAS